METPMSLQKYNQLSRVAYHVLLGFCLIVLVSGCTLFTDSIHFNITQVQRGDAQYKLVYTQQKYSDQHIEFHPELSALIINDLGNVFILNVETGLTIKHIEVPDTGIINGRLSNTRNEYFLSTWDYLQVWRTSDWMLDKQVDSMAAGDISGFSSDYKYFYSGDAIWLRENAEKIMDAPWYRSPTGYAFSKDNKYLVTSGFFFGTNIIDLENRVSLVNKNNISAVNKIGFRSDDNFYASYDAELTEGYYNYLARKLGLFNIKTNEVINSFNPPSGITSWCNIPKHGLVVGLLNGDILLLNDEFEITQKWHIEDNMEVCFQSDNNDYWFGGQSSGVYKLDLTKMTLSHEYITKNRVSDLKVSPDNKYLALVESLPGETIAKLFQIE